MSLGLKIQRCVCRQRICYLKDNLQRLKEKNSKNAYSSSDRGLAISLHTPSGFIKTKERTKQQALLQRQVTVTQASPL